MSTLQVEDPVEAIPMMRLWDVSMKELCVLMVTMKLAFVDLFCIENNCICLKWPFQKNPTINQVGPGDDVRVAVSHIYQFFSARFYNISCSDTIVKCTGCAFSSRLPIGKAGDNGETNDVVRHAANCLPKFQFGKSNKVPNRHTLLVRRALFIVFAIEHCGSDLFLRDDMLRESNLLAKFSDKLKWLVQVDKRDVTDCISVIKRLQDQGALDLFRDFFKTFALLYHEDDCVNLTGSSNSNSEIKFQCGACNRVTNILKLCPGYERFGVLDLGINGIVESPCPYRCKNLCCFCFLAKHTVSPKNYQNVELPDENGNFYFDAQCSACGTPFSNNIRARTIVGRCMIDCCPYRVIDGQALYFRAPRTASPMYVLYWVTQVLFSNTSRECEENTFQQLAMLGISTGKNDTKNEKKPSSAMEAIGETKEMDMGTSTPVDMSSRSVSPIDMAEILGNVEEGFEGGDLWNRLLGS